MDLSIFKSGPFSVIAGNSMTYQFTVSNSGANTADNVTITDPLPSQVLFVSSSVACSGTTTITCNIGSLAPSANRAVVFVVAVKPDATALTGPVFITNTASVGSDAAVDPGDNSSSAATLINESADLSVAMVASPNSEATIGQDITYKITVTNNGPSYARHVRFNDTTLGTVLGLGLNMFQIVTVQDDPNRVDSCVITPGFGTNTNSSNIDCVLIGTPANPALEPLGNWVNPPPSPNNGRWVVTVVARAVLPGDLTNTVQAVSQDTAPTPSPPTPDPNNANNFATHTLTVLPNVDLQSFSVFGAEVQTNGLHGKTIDTNLLPAMPDPACCNFGGTTVTAGRRIEWNTSTLNASSQDAHNVRIEVLLPFGTSLIENTLTSTPNAGTVPGRCSTESAGQPRTKVICTYPTLFGSIAIAADPMKLGTAALRFQVLVDPTLPLGTQLSFDSNATGDEPDPNTSNNLTSIQFDSNAWGDLNITKTGLGPTPWIAGEERVIRYDVANAGPSLSRDVVVSDSLPAGLQFVAAYLNVDGGAALNSCTIAGLNDLSCGIGDLGNPSGMRHLYVHVKVKANVANGTVLSSNGTVASDTPDPFLADNTEGDSKTISAAADGSIAVASDKDIYKTGARMHFTLTAQNNGASDAQGVVVTVTLPPKAKAQYVFNTAGCTKVLVTLTCNLGTIGAGVWKTFDVYLTAKTKGQPTVSATISSTTVDPNPANNSASKTVKVTATGVPPHPHP